MAIPVYTWQLQVKVIKLVARRDGVAQRVSGADREFDLTPYLGEAGSVRTAKSLNQAAGDFEISFGDQLDQATRDSIYSRIENMDAIEIRASREPHLYAGKSLPLITRGFISRVRRVASMGDDGKPQRAVVIVGHDSGKLWLINHVYWEMAVNLDQPLLTLFGMQAVLGLTPQIQPISKFVEEMTNKVMNSRVAAMEAFSSHLLKRFGVEATVKQGLVNPRVLETSGFNGSYWDLVAAWADRPWNELWIRDTDESGPVVVFRPAPFKDLDGKLILEADGAQDPGTLVVDDAEVDQLDVERTDARVANFFWSSPLSSSLLTNALAVAGTIADGSALESNHGNNHPALFGWRKMQQDSVLLSNDAKGAIMDVPEAARDTEGRKWVDWFRYRALELQNMNHDNSALEDGAATLMGRETYQVGKYLQITQGQITSEFYVTAVSHVFRPLAGWTTSVRLERGNGFLARAKVSGSPYVLQGMSGPYSRRRS